MRIQEYNHQIKSHFYLFNHKRGAILHPILLFAAVSILLYSLFEIFKSLDLWNAMALAGGNTLHFCEFNRNDLIIKQIANTWSNLAYLFVGFILLSIGLKDHLFKKRHELNNLIARHPGFTVMLGVALIYLFIGSFFYHASLTRTFQILDVAGIYAVVIAMLAYNIFRAFPTIRLKQNRKLTHKAILAIGLVLNIFVVVEVYKWNINVVFPILIGLLLVFNILHLKNKKVTQHYVRYVWLAISSMSVAGTLWILDRSNVLCNPTSIFQGHALWHILTAMAVLMTYLSYRTETFSTEDLIAQKAV